MAAADVEVHRIASELALLAHIRQFHAFNELGSGGDVYNEMAPWKKGVRRKVLVMLLMEVVAPLSSLETF